MSNRKPTRNSGLVMKVASHNYNHLSPRSDLGGQYLVHIVKKLPYNVYTGSAITASSVYTFLRGWYYSLRVRCTASHGTSPCRLLTEHLIYLGKVLSLDADSPSRLVADDAMDRLACNQGNKLILGFKG